MDKIIEKKKIQRKAHPLTQETMFTSCTNSFPRFNIRCAVPVILIKVCGLATSVLNINIK